MDGKDLQKQAESRAQELPGTELTHPFGLDIDVWKICGKMFMFLTELDGEQIVNLKANPLDSEALRKTHRDITPGWHMNKKHWVSIILDGSMTDEEIGRLIEDSYALTAPKKRKNKDADRADIRIPNA